MENDWPNLPTKRHTAEEPVDTHDFQSDANPLQVSDKDLETIPITTFEKKVFINEMKDCDMYLHNLHKGFRAVTSLDSAIKLVGACLGVHKHKRQVMKDLSQTKEPAEADPNTVEFDDNGRIIKRK